MARGDKNYTEVVRKVNSGQSANAKIAAIHAMVEALIQEDNDEAVEQLRNYLQLKSRQILLGEEDDDEMEDADDDSGDDDEFAPVGPEPDRMSEVTLGQERNHHFPAAGKEASGSFQSQPRGSPHDRPPPAARLF